MEKDQLPQKIKELRKRKGLSQEALADSSGISERTVQRIENGESSPTGDTLRRLATALGITPDELMDWTLQEDNQYLVFLHLSALSFIPFPILGILIPFMIWISKRNAISGVQKVGVNLINFQIIWVLLLILIPGSLILLSTFDIVSFISFNNVFKMVGIMYGINASFLVANVYGQVKGKYVGYWAPIKFLQ